jgi:hypothetical protein
MAKRRVPGWLALTLTPMAGASLWTAGAGATLMIAMAALAAAIGAVASALAPYLPAWCRERSRARVRRAAIEHKLTVDEAVALMREDHPRDKTKQSASLD